MSFGQTCAPGECHRILDEALEGEADAVPGSDSMYCFAGVNPRVEEGELFHMCFPCLCQVCREQATPSVDFRECPNITQTGIWRQSACHRSYGVVQRAEKRRDDEKLFAQKIQKNELLAAAADPNWAGNGGRKYWLLRTRSKPFILHTTIRSKVRGMSGIKKGTFVVKAQWYEATDNAGRKYKLMPEVVRVTIRSIIQEQQLEFARGGSQSGDNLFPDDQHARLMAHNFANYF